MRFLIALIALIACIAYASAGRKNLVRAYPYKRNTINRSATDEYPMMPQNHDNYYMHNYVRASPNDGYPYFGYPYGECSSCRKYQTEEVVKPDCPCQQH